MVEITSLDEDIQVLSDPYIGIKRPDRDNGEGNETDLQSGNSISPNPDAKEILLPASDIPGRSIQAGSVLSPLLTSSDDSTPLYRNKPRTGNGAGTPPAESKISSSLQSLKLVLVDSRLFCKTRRKRLHSLAASDLVDLHRCSCDSHSYFPSAPKGGKDCHSCAENSDDEYDDDAVAIPNLRRKARRKPKMDKTSGSVQNSSLKPRKRGIKIQPKLSAGDEEVTGCCSPFKRKKMEQAASQVVQNTIEKVDWNEAAVELAGIQVTCQRKMAAEANGRNLGELRQQMQVEVAQSLRTYWRRVLEKSISS